MWSRERMSCSRKPCRKSREDMPNLKFIQLASAGYNHLMSTPL